MNNLLNSMLENTMEGTLKHEVVEIIMDQAEELDNDNEVLELVKEIVNYGCQSGIVASLVYYKDTEAFFNRHVDEILELIEDAKQTMDMNYIEFSRNNLSWFAFEIIAQEIYHELEEATEF